MTVVDTHAIGRTKLHCVFTLFATLNVYVCKKCLKIGIFTIIFIENCYNVFSIHVKSPIYLNKSNKNQRFVIKKGTMM